MCRCVYLSGGRRSREPNAVEDDPGTMALEVRAGSFTDSIDRFSNLQAASMRNDAVIKMQERHAEIHERTIAELEEERKHKLVKLEDLRRLLASTQQQTHQLKEDISTAEQYASCFKMRSALDTHDEDPDLSQEVEQRKRKAILKIEGTRRVLPEVRALVEERSRGRLLEELKSIGGDNPLARWVTSANALVVLCKQLMHAKQVAEGSPPQHEVPADEQLDAIAQGLDDKLRTHLAPDGGGRRLVELAAGRLEKLRAPAASLVGARANDDDGGAQADEVTPPPKRTRHAAGFGRASLDGVDD